MDSEAINPGLVAPLGLGGHDAGVDLEEDVVERGPEVRAVDGVVPAGFRVVDVFAPGAVQLHVALPGAVVLAHR